jgi:hypothetical protein
MESRTFIKTAGDLIADIGEFRNALLAHEDEIAQGTALQKRIDAAFTGLSNPTLPSAGKLVSVALDAGFGVNPAVRQRLADAERCW